jgi:anaerobic selenocysteine-containing dehydrogenase
MSAQNEKISRFPDVTYLERWELSGSHPNITFKVQGVRQPVVAPLTGTVKVYGQEMALQWEALLLAIAEKLELPNFGPNGLGDGIDFAHPDDLYIRMTMNLAYGEKPDLEDAVPEASPEEIDIFIKARARLPKAVFDPERWKKSAGICGRVSSPCLRAAGASRPTKKVILAMASAPVPLMNPMSLPPATSLASSSICTWKRTPVSNIPARARPSRRLPSMLSLTPVSMAKQLTTVPRDTT